MKNTVKRILTIALAMILTLSAAAFVGCGKDKGSDLEYVKENGKLIVGITDFKPMDYQENGSDKWIGFDADMAAAFAKYIGVDVEFVVIDWDSKLNELNTKKIDCIWNGMTLDDGIKASMETSKAYCLNAQVVVVSSDKKDQYTTVDSIKTLNFAAEGGSAGEKQLASIGITAIPVADQAAALREVASGKADACVIDLLMAGAMIGEGTAYPDLSYTVKLNSEEYGVGFRKGSDLAAKLNDFFASSYASGEMKTIASTYGVQESLIAQ